MALAFLSGTLRRQQKRLRLTFNLHVVFSQQTDFTGVL